MQSRSDTTLTLASTVKLALDRPDLERSVRDEPGFRLHLLRWLVAVASDDGHVNLAEYQLIRAMAEEGGSAHELLTALRAIEQPQPADTALALLRETAPQLDEDARRQALVMAIPLLRLQGSEAVHWANTLAAALGINLPPIERATCVEVAQSASISSALFSPIRTIRAHSLRSTAVETFRMTGDKNLTSVIEDYAAGGASLQEMAARITAVLNETNGRCRDFEHRLGQMAADVPSTRRDLESAESFFDQIGQRLAIVEARIEADKAQFDEEFDEVIHDAGNAVELEMLDRLKTDDWSLKTVWDSMGRSTFAKELERRVDRIARRHERQLQLMKEDLRLFQKEYRLVQVQVLQRTHHSKLSALMPSLRTGTRVRNATEDIADVTIGAGVLAGLGTGAAIYALGAAVVLPVIAPIAPIAGGALLVAGAIKWAMDKPARKDEEVRDKRLALEHALKERLSEMRSSYFGQLDRTGQEFLGTARILARPVLLEAQAGHELATLEKRVGEVVLRRSRQSVGNLLNQLQM